MDTPPPAVVGPPPRPSASAYLPLLPPNTTRQRTDTTTLHQEFCASRPLHQSPIAPTYTPRIQGSPQKKCPPIPKRARSEHNINPPSGLKQTTFSVAGGASKWKDFSQWRLGCPTIIIMAVEFVARHGVSVEGVFRISGETNKISALMEKARTGNAEAVYEGLLPVDVYNVADFLLKWCYDSFGSVVTPQIYTHLIKNTTGEIDSFPKTVVKGLIFCLPPEELSTLMALLQVCQLISAAGEVTKMSSQALATCIAPNLFYNAAETDLKAMQVEAHQCNKIFEFLIDDFPYLLQDMETGKSVQLSSRVLTELGELGEGLLDSTRGRSESDDRKPRNGSGSSIFRRKSRSRSRKQKGLRK